MLMQAEAEAAARVAGSCGVAAAAQRAPPPPHLTMHIRSNLDSRVSKSGTGSASGASASYLGARQKEEEWSSRDDRPPATPAGQRHLSRQGGGGGAPGTPGGVGACQRVGQVAERVQLRQGHYVEPHGV